MYMYVCMYAYIYIYIYIYIYLVILHYHWQPVNMLLLQNGVGKSAAPFQLSPEVD